MLSTTHMPEIRGFRHYSRMDVYEVRRAKLILLTTEHGRDAVALRVNTNADYLSQIQGDKRSRSMGAKLARRLEKAFNKPHGWMDTLMEDTGAVDQETLDMVQAIQSLPSSHRAAIQALLSPASKSGSDD